MKRIVFFISFCVLFFCGCSSDSSKENGFLNINLGSSFFNEVFASSRDGEIDENKAEENFSVALNVSRIVDGLNLSSQSQKITPKTKSLNFIVPMIEYDQYISVRIDVKNSDGLLVFSAEDKTKFTAVNPNVNLVLKKIKVKIHYIKDGKENHTEELNVVSLPELIKDFKLYADKDFKSEWDGKTDITDIYINEGSSDKPEEPKPEEPALKEVTIHVMQGKKEVKQEKVPFVLSVLKEYLEKDEYKDLKVYTDSGCSKLWDGETYAENLYIVMVKEEPAPEEPEPEEPAKQEVILHFRNSEETSNVDFSEVKENISEGSTIFTSNSYDFSRIWDGKTYLAELWVAPKMTVYYSKNGENISEQMSFEDFYDFQYYISDSSKFYSDAKFTEEYNRNRPTYSEEIYIIDFTNVTIKLVAPEKLDSTYKVLMQIEYENSGLNKFVDNGSKSFNWNESKSTYEKVFNLPVAENCTIKGEIRHDGKVCYFSNNSTEKWNIKEDFVLNNFTFMKSIADVELKSYVFNLKVENNEFISIYDENNGYFDSVNANSIEWYVNGNKTTVTGSKYAINELKSSEYVENEKNTIVAIIKIGEQMYSCNYIYEINE